MTTRAVIWAAVSTKQQAEDERESLPRQRRFGEDLCKKNAWDLVEVLEVPGFSRAYIDIHECAREMSADNIEAFSRLLELWEARGFDVLIVRDGNRFARTQTLHSYVVEYTITKADARIFVTSTNLWVDSSNFRQFIAMDGYRAASEIDSLKALNRIGMEGRMKRGLSGGETPMCYRVVRDPQSGRSLRLEVKEELRHLWDDAANLLLEGIGWKAFPTKLCDLGHVNPNTGKWFHDNAFYRLFYNPFVWGVSARGYNNKLGLWVFDETVPVPDGVLVCRHPNPPVPPLYTGELADKVRAELRRRSEIIKGHASPKNSYKFTGLIECGDCGWRMTIAQVRKRYYYWHCSHRLRAPEYYPDTDHVCTNRKFLPDKVAQEQIDSFISQLLTLKRPDLAAFVGRTELSTAEQRVSRLEKDIANVKKQIGNMIYYQSKAEDNIHDIYGEDISVASGHLAKLEAHLHRTRQSLESPEVGKARELAYEEIVRTGLENFWHQPPRTINQTLHRILGHYRFRALHGEIIGLSRPNPISDSDELSQFVDSESGEDSESLRNVDSSR